MEKFNLKDLVNIQSALKFRIEEYQGTKICTESEEKTLEKVDELIWRYCVD